MSGSVSEHTVKQILTDPNFDPSDFLGDMITKWMMDNGEEIVKKFPAAINYMIEDEKAAVTVANNIPLEQEELLARFVGKIKDDSDSVPVSRLLPRLVARIKHGQYTENLLELTLSIVGNASIYSVNYEQIFRVLGEHMDLNHVVNIINQLGSKNPNLSEYSACACMLKYIHVDLFKTGLIIDVLKKYFYCICPKCGKRFTKSGYTLHVKHEYRSYRGRRYNNPCHNQTTVFDVVRERLGIKVDRPLAWW